MQEQSELCRRHTATDLKTAKALYHESAVKRQLHWDFRREKDFVKLCGMTVNLSSFLLEKFES